jgi:hypothetical protein
MHSDKCDHLLTACMSSCAYQEVAAVPLGSSCTEVGIAWDVLDETCSTVCYIQYIHRHEHGILLSQEQHTQSILQRFGYQSAYAKRTLFNAGVRFRLSACTGGHMIVLCHACAQLLGP